MRAPTRTPWGCQEIVHLEWVGRASIHAKDRKRWHAHEQCPVHTSRTPCLDLDWEGPIALEGRAAALLTKPFEARGPVAPAVEVAGKGHAWHSQTEALVARARLLPTGRPPGASVLRKCTPAYARAAAQGRRSSRTIGAQVLRRHEPALAGALRLRLAQVHHLPPRTQTEPVRRHVEPKVANHSIEPSLAKDLAIHRVSVSRESKCGRRLLRRCLIGRRSSEPAGLTQLSANHSIEAHRSPAGRRDEPEHPARGGVPLRELGPAEMSSWSERHLERPPLRARVHVACVVDDFPELDEQARTARLVVPEAEVRVFPGPALVLPHHLDPEASVALDGLRSELPRHDETEGREV
eukprot:CAMPEP_0183344166 /NCGR_PEP_ID=MMETSP0164_2-20130417/9914_1 /TAXON_ID=221442 /ORGANISM="Coccolithus pelagicus ssp braarudi, Strain PLY182g" /LENGTH=350 /DNA_ID=CAMNT_0025515131 /DNA_START=307 /DNA_END=1360 /DNA_ORIENTATION=-